jgi:hypothetical protein
MMGTVGRGQKGLKMMIFGGEVFSKKDEKLKKSLRCYNFLKICKNL